MREDSMVAVFVAFQSDSPLDRGDLLERFDARRPAFEGMAGLRAKSFWIDEARREFGGFYVFSSSRSTSTTASRRRRR